MNRMNWIQYLKMVYDQLEKTMVPEEVPRQLNNHKSFLSINTRSSKEVASSNLPFVRQVEKVSRDQLVKAIKKVMNLLPLMPQKEYLLRYPSEKGITFEQVQNYFMVCQYRELTWDKIMDLLVMINIEDQGLVASSLSAGSA